MEQVSFQVHSGIRDNFLTGRRKENNGTHAVDTTEAERGARSKSTNVKISRADIVVDTAKVEGNLTRQKEIEEETKGRRWRIVVISTSYQHMQSVRTPPPLPPATHVSLRYTAHRQRIKQATHNNVCVARVLVVARVTRCGNGLGARDLSVDPRRHISRQRNQRRSGIDGRLGVTLSGSGRGREGVKRRR